MRINRAKVFSRISSSLLFTVLLLANMNGVAEAHILKQDNGVSAELHIPPEDNPKAAQPTELDLSFANRANTFSLQDCSCVIAVSRDGQVGQKSDLRPALAGATLESANTVTFPDVGVYDVIVRGSAKDGAFSSFELDYIVRVTTAVGATQPSGSRGEGIVIISAGSLLVVAMLAATAITKGGRYPRQTEKQNKSSRTKSRKN